MENHSTFKSYEDHESIFYNVKINGILRKMTAQVVKCLHMKNY